MTGISVNLSKMQYKTVTKIIWLSLKFVLKSVNNTYVEWLFRNIKRQCLCYVMAIFTDDSPHLPASNGETPSTQREINPSADNKRSRHSTATTSRSTISTRPDSKPGKKGKK